eukprot:540170-Prymnesium_polylepis.2
MLLNAHSVATPVAIMATAIAIDKKVASKPGGKSSAGTNAAVRTACASGGGRGLVRRTSVGLSGLGHVRGGRGLVRRTSVGLSGLGHVRGRSGTCIGLKEESAACGKEPDPTVSPRWDDEAAEAKERIKPRRHATGNDQTESELALEGVADETVHNVAHDARCKCDECHVARRKLGVDPAVVREPELEHAARDLADATKHGH